jgi:hypothetical protein
MCPLCKCTTFSYPFLWNEGHLGYFQLLAIINKAAMNIVDHVSLLQLGPSSGICPRVVLLDLLVELCQFSKEPPN